MSDRNRAILWARVSTDDQDEGNQLPELEAAAERRGLRVVEVKRSRGVSATGNTNTGRAAHKEAIDELVDRGHAGEYDVLLVVSLDRLTRKGIKDTVITMDRLQSAGVKVISIRDSITGAPEWAEEFIQAAWATMARIAYDGHSEHTKAGMKNAKEKGVKMGRPVVRDGVDVPLVLTMRHRGDSWATVHKAHPATIRNAETGGMKKPSIRTIRRVVAAASKEEYQTAMTGGQQ